MPSTVSLLDNLERYSTEKTRMVLAVVALQAYLVPPSLVLQQSRRQALLDASGLVVIRLHYVETKFKAVQAALVQLLAIFAESSRFKSIIGVRYGFVGFCMQVRLLLLSLPALHWWCWWWWWCCCCCCRCWWWWWWC